VPESFWQAFFLSSNPTLAKIEGPLVVPLVAMVSFVCSVGNVLLWLVQSSRELSQHQPLRVGGEDRGKTEVWIKVHGLALHPSSLSSSADDGGAQ
jgi:hypothetical protein